MTNTEKQKRPLFYPVPRNRQEAFVLARKLGRDAEEIERQIDQNQTDFQDVPDDELSDDKEKRFYDWLDRARYALGLKRGQLRMLVDMLNASGMKFTVGSQAAASEKRLRVV